jgi:hypothetical protein
VPKPPISIVSSSEPPITPPRPLGTHGLSLWTSILAEYRITDRGGIELLAQACATVDRVEALRAAIDHDGEVVATRGGPKAHPALRDELAGRAFIVRTLERLGLNVEAIKSGPGRPPRPFGWTG